MSDVTIAVDQIIARARQRGLAVDAERVALFQAGLASLLTRAQRLGELLPSEVAPPPSTAPGLAQ
jgi:hypothetical protein